MLVIAKGVLHTGVVSRATYRLLATVHSPAQALRRLIPPVGFVSALINTTPIVAMLIPASKELQQRSGVPRPWRATPDRARTTLAGSSMLIGTSSNLLIAGLASSAGVSLSNLIVMRPGGYSNATFFRFGVLLTLVSLVTAFLIGWALLSL